VNEELKKSNLRVIVWDAYRPHECQLRLWKLCGNKSGRYLANPHHAPSLHSHGSAMDLGLCHLDGSPAAMPTDFDDFRPEAGSNFPCPDPEAAANLMALKRAIWNNDCGTLPTEWWHFMDQNWERIPYIDLGFAQIDEMVKLRK
jgi:zinc D-Ala-D-Ala dipeptidase